MEGKKYKGTAVCQGSDYTQRSKMPVTTENRTESRFFSSTCMVKFSYNKLIISNLFLSLLQRSKEAHLLYHSKFGVFQEKSPLCHSRI